MLLVVDTNRIIAAVLRDSSSRRILSSKKLAFITPRFAYHEVLRHRASLIAKSGLSGRAFDSTLYSILSKIRQVDNAELAPFFESASKVMAEIDYSDILFIALALSTSNDGIWTEDRHFERQSVVRVWKTAELLQLL